jgi:cytochrome c-type biogenesis protein CcmH
MLVFWLIAVILLVTVMALVLPAILRANKLENQDVSAEKAEIFKQQFEELEQDRLNGILDSTQYVSAKSELERRLIEEVNTTQLVFNKHVPDVRLAVILLIAIPLLAVLIYLKIGSPASVSIPAVSPLTTKAHSAVQHSIGMSDLEPLLGSLEKKLEKNPNDGEGWALLARSYVELRQHAKAIAPYEKAAQLIPNDPQLLADYADALAVVNGHKVAGKPEALVLQALKLDPHHVKALMLAATAAFDRKDYKKAMAYWQTLKQDLPVDSELLPEIKASLNEASVLSGEKIIAEPTTPLPKQVSEVSGVVSVSSKLIDKLDSAATVFIFARDAKGAPMPIAIARATVNQLPYTYHLNDSSAIMPDHKLSTAQEVVVVARISKSGDAKQQAGDLQGVTKPFTLDGSAVDIEINQIVP